MKYDSGPGIHKSKRYRAVDLHVYVHGVLRPATFFMGVVVSGLDSSARNTVRYCTGPPMLAAYVPDEARKSLVAILVMYTEYFGSLWGMPKLWPTITYIDYSKGAKAHVSTPC